MPVTDAVFHEPMSWLNAAVDLNIPSMSLTDAVFQPPMFWLNAAADTNIRRMSLTAATFHLETSALNVGLSLNRLPMSETAATSHSDAGPYVAAAVVGLVAHSVTAAPILDCVMQVAHTEPTVHASLKVPKLGHAPCKVAPHAV
jgi:hypothetical protein